MVSLSITKFREIAMFPQQVISKMKLGGFGKLKQLEKDTFELTSAIFPQKKAMDSLNKFNFCSAFTKTSKYSLQILDTKPTQITEIQKDGTKASVQAFISTVERHYKTDETMESLFVFSKEGKILSNIEYLDKEEHLKGKFKEKGIDKYLRLQYLNASHFDNYKGIGTALVEEAKLKSREYGLGGNLLVYASNYLKSKKHSTPIPFYAKQGFIDIDNPQLSKEALVKRYASTCKQFYMFLLNEN